MPFVDVGGVTRLDASPPDPANPRVDDSDGYPAVIADQRSMLVGGDECLTAEDVFWQCWVPFLERKNMVPVVMADEVIPYISWSRWVANCPTCNGGMACWDRNPYACCLSCGEVRKVAWQLPHTRSEVIRLLAGRPVQHRNWNAHKGETVAELAVQNVLMQGIEPELRNGLLVAGNVTLPDQFSDATAYLESLRAARTKAA